MENKLKVLFLTKYSEQGASSRYRFFNYLRWFEESNIHATYKPLFGDRYIAYLYSRENIRKNIVGILSLFHRIWILLFDIRKFDHIVIEAELLPKLPLKLEMYFLNRMKSFSLDFDDNISANYLGTCLEDKIRSIIFKAKFVTVGNHWYFSEFEGNLIYLPTVIDIDRYPIFKIENKTEKTIVWIGSPSTAKYLLLIEQELVDLSEKSHFILKIIGARIDLDPRINVQYLKWDAETENKELAESTVGIMPLIDSYWEKGKCGFKLIQYMGSGIPVVASTLPANQEIIENGINGFLAKDSQDWIHYLHTILEDDKLAASLGDSARKRIEYFYCYQRWGTRYAEIIKKNR